LSLAVLLTIAVFVVLEYGGGLPRPPDASGPFIVLLPLWLLGSAVRSWRLRAEALEDRAGRLEREQESLTQAAVAEERARIARELHDLVAHGVSVMVVQAGAARQVMAQAPDKATDALLAVEATGRSAMADLRHLLGLLAADQSDADRAPQPGLAQLDALVRRIAEAGLPALLQVEGCPCPLPPGLDLAAYRIVQEALTNALKYAGGAPTIVRVLFADEGLKVEVLDEGRDGHRTNAGAQGRGLVGMRERAALYGGWLEAGPRLERGYAVRAWLPLTGPPA
jgi:signal transduction histidine kinase